MINPALNMRVTKVLGILHGGLGIAVAKNIAYKKTYPIPQREFAAMAMPADINTNDSMDVV